MEGCGLEDARAVTASSVNKRETRDEYLKQRRKAATIPAKSFVNKVVGDVAERRRLSYETHLGHPEESVLTSADDRDSYAVNMCYVSRSSARVHACPIELRSW